MDTLILYDQIFVHLKKKKKKDFCVERALHGRISKFYYFTIACKSYKQARFRVVYYVNNRI